MTINLSPKVQGFYKITATDSISGKTRVVADWFPNLITNAGLNRMGVGGVQTTCMVGSGNSLPSVLDTTLQFQVASTTSITAQSDTAKTVPPYYGVTTRNFRFNPGVAAGNLSEVGIGWTNILCFSRALILDSSNNPTTITVLPSEYLDVVYELRLYPPLEDEHFELFLEGNKHLITLRASSVTSNEWAPSLSSGVWFWTPASQTTYSGGIGSITSTPSGLSHSVGANNFEYENNSLTKKGYAIFSLDQSNYPGGIRSMRFYTYYCAGMYQMEFDPPIPKDSTKTFRIDFGVTWARNV